jgi:hypothetical protein
VKLPKRLGGPGLDTRRGLICSCYVNEVSKNLQPWEELAELAERGGESALDRSIGRGLIICIADKS